MERAQPAKAPRLRKRKAPASGGRKRRAGRGGTAEVEAAVAGENRARSGAGRSGIFSTSASCDYGLVGPTWAKLLRCWLSSDISFFENVFRFF